jgi:RNA polymerase sigma factor (sigma-70 family)
MGDAEELLRFFDDLAAQLAKRYPSYADFAPDAVQQAMVKLSLQEPKPDHPEAWMFRVAQNAMLDHIRSQERSPVEYGADIADHQAVTGPPTLSGTTTRTLSAELVQQVLDQLPERDRDLLRDMYMQGVSARDLAARHELKESSMGRIMDRARSKFRESFRNALRQRRSERS